MMNSSSSWKVEITVLSGEDLRIHGIFVKKNAFAAVKFDRCHSHSTKLDDLGGRNPLWEEQFEIDLPTSGVYLTLEVRCRQSKGNRLVGTARVPVSEFFRDYLPENYLQFFSYLLMDEKGNKNGIINFSVRVRPDPPLAIKPMVPEYSQVRRRSGSDMRLWV